MSKVSRASKHFSVLTKHIIFIQCKDVYEATSKVIHKGLKLLDLPEVSTLNLSNAYGGAKMATM